jgi:membrane protein
MTGGSVLSIEAIPHRIGEWWRRAAWGEPAAGASTVQSVGRALLRAWGEAVRSYSHEQLDMRAHALTFRTLLSLVPLIAVLFSVFKAFGGLTAGEQAVQRLLARNLAPGAAADVFEHVRGFVGRVSAGAVGGLGVLFLFVTVVSLLSYIERSMNAQWGITRGRPFLARFVVYWSSLTVGPVLLALSLSISSAAQASALVAPIDAVVPGARAFLFSLVPWLVSCTALSLLYAIVPYTSVRWTAALGGGLVAGTLWELGKRAFTWASGSLLSYDAVYGSFAALPVFLMWLQVGWVIVLLGNKMTYVLQHAHALRDERIQREVGPAGRELLALACMIKVADAFRSGKPPPTLSELLPGTRSVLQAEQEVLNRLEAGGLVRATAVGDSDEADGGEQGYLPARDPAAISVEEILSVLARDGIEPEELACDEPASRLACEVLSRAREASGSVTSSASLAELAERARASGAPG